MKVFYWVGMLRSNADVYLYLPVFSMEYVKESWTEKPAPHDDSVQFLHEEGLAQFYSVTDN